VSSSGALGMMDSDLEEVLQHVDWPIRVIRRQKDYKTPFSLVHFDGLRKRLRMFGLLNNKHIPRSYLRASIKDRIELLRGLMDTDGTCDKDGGPELALSDKMLAKDAHELVVSLGIKTACSTRWLSKKNKNHADSHRLKLTVDF